MTDLGPRHTRISADEVIETLGLEVLPHEGGSFRETYRAAGVIPGAALAVHGARAPRNFSTQIYYLLRAGETSALHRVRSDEVFHHYLGDPVAQLVIEDTAQAGPQAWEWLLGADLRAEQRPQRVVPANAWQGARLAEGGQYDFALLGCTVAPGFDWADFELIDEPRSARLIEQHPAFAEAIRVLTPVPGRTRA